MATATIIGLLALLIALTGVVVAIFRWVREVPHERYDVFMLVTILVVLFSCVIGLVLIVPQATNNAPGQGKSVSSHGTPTPSPTLAPTPTKISLSLPLYCQPCYPGGNGIQFEPTLKQITLDSVQDQTTFHFVVHNAGTNSCITGLGPGTFQLASNGNPTNGTFDQSSWQTPAPGAYAVIDATTPALILQFNTTYSLVASFTCGFDTIVYHLTFSCSATNKCTIPTQAALYLPIHPIHDPFSLVASTSPQTPTTQLKVV